MHELASIQHDGNCCPFISRVSPVTPYGSTEVMLTLPIDTPGCSIDMLELMSRIRLLDIPSISTDIVGVPCSNRIGTLGLLTAFSGRLRWKELSSFTPSSRFPDLWLAYSLPFWFCAGPYQWGILNASNVHSDFSFQVNWWS